MKINQFVVMYLDTDEVVRPLAPPDVSPVKRYLVVLLLSFSWHSGALLYVKVLEGRAVHRAAVSRYRAAEEAGSRVGCQGLALDEDRCVGLCEG
jgi:hypothetical protein